MSDHPEKDEIEISIFGGGNSYGESIVAHLGDRLWIIVDSIINPHSGLPIAVEYLNDIGCNLSEEVKLILATHWHDDHIKGLSDIVFRCNKAIFACSSALEKTHFLTLLGKNDLINSPNSGVNEFQKILEICKKNKISPKRATEDRLLLSWNPIESIQGKLVALSPSDKSIELFEQDLKEIIGKEIDPNSIIPVRSPNHSSVVLLICIGNNNILLGADLEDTSDLSTGWNAVLSCQSCPESVLVYKVPHHGSSNAHSDIVWEKIISKRPLIGLTPFGRGKKRLPEKEVVNKILLETDLAYITSDPLGISLKKKGRPYKTRKMIKDLGYEVREREFLKGHIRFRKKAYDEKGPWKVQLFGKAKKLENIL